MANEDQLDIVQVRPGCWRLEFPYHPEFIAFLKRRVPAQDRSYNPDTHSWEIRGDQYLAAIEGVGVQKFTHASRKFRRDGKLVWLNLVSHQEMVQEELF